jgi:hypothetical protein
VKTTVERHDLRTAQKGASNKSASIHRFGDAVFFLRFLCLFAAIPFFAIFAFFLDRHSLGDAVAAIPGCVLS